MLSYKKGDNMTIKRASKSKRKPVSKAKRNIAKVKRKINKVKKDVKNIEAKAKIELAKAQASFKKHEADVKKYIRKNPEKAMAIAVGVGAALGKIVLHKRKK
jgi:ElaB/YqjD/DUF883 family membrane-anchored ribosome-binding protein